FLDARHWSAMSWPPKSTAHHTGAKRLYSTVSEPAVDTNPAQHHLSSFASQFVGIGFVGQRRGGAHDFGCWLAGSRNLESPPSKQIFEERLGGLIMARRGRRPDGKRRAGNLKALGFGGGIDHDGRDTEAILGHRKLQPRQRRRFRACSDGRRPRWRMRRGHRHRWRQDTVADKPASQRRFIALSGELGGGDTEHAGGHLAEKGRYDGRGANTLDQNRTHILADLQQRGLVSRLRGGQHAGQSFEKRAGKNAREGVRLRAERSRRRRGRKRVGVPVEKSIHRIAQTVGLDCGRNGLADGPAELFRQSRKPGRAAKYAARLRQYPFAHARQLKRR